MPPEVLTMVFLSLRDSVKRSNSMQWLTIMQVCRRWHDIALSNPCLWAKIYVDRRHQPPPRTLTAILDRSGTVDLEIDVSMMTRRRMCNFVTPLLVPHARRIKALHFKHSPECKCADVQKLVDGLGPRLVSLSLNYKLSLGPLVTSLRSLSMVRVEIRLQAHLDRLIHLELNGLSSYPSHEDVYLLLDRLAQYCPNVETLALLDMACVHAADAAGDIDIIPYTPSFPNLRVLKLRDDPKDLPVMVGAFVVPAHVSVRLEVETRHWKEWAGKSGSRPFKELLRLLGGPNEAQPAAALPFERAILDVGTEDHLARFEAFTTASDESPRRSVTIVRHPDVDSRRVPDFSELHRVFLEDLLALSPILRPLELEVHLADHLVPTTWSNLLFAWYPDVQKLTIGGTQTCGRFVCDLFRSKSPQFQELVLCTGDSSELDVVDLVATIMSRGKRSEQLLLRRLVFCLRFDDSAGPLLEALAFLPPQVRYEIVTRKCPVCHRVATPDDVAVSISFPSSVSCEHLLTSCSGSCFSHRANR